MKDNIREKAVKNQFAKDKNFREVVYKLFDIIHGTQKQYFKWLYKDTPKETINEMLEIVRDEGFPISIDTNFGSIKGRFNVNPVILSAYSDIICRLANVRSKSEDIDLDLIDEKDEEFAQIASAFLIRLFLEKLNKELEGITSEAYALAQLEFEKITKKSKIDRKFIEQITKKTEKRRKLDFGITRGGYRGKETFWSDEKKSAFYKKVTSLPKVRGVKVWKYIFDELVLVDFDLETQTWLKERPELKIIPDFLFDEAISKWRKYYSVREIKKKEEKLRFFEYRLALYLLEYPDESKFLSLDTYFKKGKKIQKKRDFQNANLKISKNKEKLKKIK